MNDASFGIFQIVEVPVESQEFDAEVRLERVDREAERLPFAMSEPHAH